MELIATTTVGAGGALSIDFTSIPQSYTDLTLVVAARHTSSNSDFGILQINGTTTNYSFRYLIGDGSSTGSNTSSNIGLTNSIWIGNILGTSSTSNTFSNFRLYLPNYAGSANKIVSIESVNENNTTTAHQFFNAGLWSNTAAITSLSIKTYNDWTFAQYSTASLYGILKGSGGATVS